MAKRKIDVFKGTAQKTKTTIRFSEKELIDILKKHLLSEGIVIDDDLSYIRLFSSHDKSQGPKRPFDLHMEKTHKLQDNLSAALTN